MANIKWSGIESFKYGLTARWYVSAFYGNDVDVDGVGYYNPSTNVAGHGGATRPFSTLSKIYQDATIATNSIVVVDSGYYAYTLTTTKVIIFVGDGTVNYSNPNPIGTSSAFHNMTILSSNLTNCAVIDGNVVYCTGSYIGGITGGYATKNTKIIESTWGAAGVRGSGADNCTFIRSTFLHDQPLKNICIINCPDATIFTVTPRPVGVIKDYSIIIGTVKSNRSINGKTTGVTIEDFKIDGNYFVKSNSEVNLFGNASGSGASVAQLQTIFNNYFSPIYLDTWQDIDLSLKPSASDIVKFGGLNGTYIGALPVGYRFSASSLYNTYIDAVNSSNLAWDAVNSAIIIANGFDTAVYRSIRISLSQPIIVDPINFFANLVYNSEGTARQGVANQRIDTTPDLEPVNTLNQRVVYDYKLAYSPNNVDALSAFKNFELNNVPYVDNEGESMLNDNYDSSERQRITIQDFMIEFTLRKIVIE